MPLNPPDRMDWPRGNDTIQLFGRHPALALSPELGAWLGANGLSGWHETRRDSDQLSTVVVEAARGDALFAALVERRLMVADSTITERVDRTTDFRLGPGRDGIGADRARQVALAHPSIGPRRILAVSPVVDWNAATPSPLWEVEVLGDSLVDTYIVARGDLLRQTGSRPVGMLRPGRRVMRGLRAATADPALEENELHHLSQYGDLAREWTKDAATVTEKAKMICGKVALEMRYSPKVDGIVDFTWADTLVIELQNWRGICDEYCVVAVTLLRALEIPGVIKFIQWKTTELVGHACVEWYDGTEWRHLDPQMNVFDRRSIYRDLGARNVVVTDADSPLDARNTADTSLGSKDPTGDLKLQPYRDFLPQPPNWGPRVGYSDP